MEEFTTEATEGSRVSGGYEHQPSGNETLVATVPPLRPVRTLASGRDDKLTRLSPIRRGEGRALRDPARLFLFSIFYILISLFWFLPCYRAGFVVELWDRGLPRR